VLLWLNVEWNGLGESGATVLGAMLAKNNTLKYLNVSNTRISNTGSMAVGKGLEQNRQLLNFVIDHNPITDQGALALVKGAAGCDTLESISIKVRQYDGLSKFRESKCQRTRATSCKKLSEQRPSKSSNKAINV
jgi:hypothetical protein